MKRFLTMCWISHTVNLQYSFRVSLMLEVRWLDDKNNTQSDLSSEIIYIPFTSPPPLLWLGNSVRWSLLTIDPKLLYSESMVVLLAPREAPTELLSNSVGGSASVSCDVLLDPPMRNFNLNGAIRFSFERIFLDGKNFWKIKNSTSCKHSAGLICYHSLLTITSENKIWRIFF